MDESERDFAINIFLGRIILEYFTSGKFKKRRISFLAEFHSVNSEHHLWNYLEFL